MSNLIIREFQGKTIRQREDGYLSLTDMAQSTGKRYADWARLESTKSYLVILSGSVQIPTDRLIEVNTSSGANDQRGTWGHRKVAIRFAQWCSDEFAVQVDTWIETLLLEGVVMTSQATSHAVLKEWETQGLSSERLLSELNILVSKQDALKFGAAYHGKLIKIREYAQRKVLCEDTKNDKLWFAIGKLEEQLLEEYKSSDEFPQEFWKQFYDSETRQYWISQWRDGKYYKTHLNKTLGE